MALCEDFRVRMWMLKWVQLPLVSFDHGLGRTVMLLEARQGRVHVTEETDIEVGEGTAYWHCSFALRLVTHDNNHPSVYFSHVMGLLAESVDSESGNRARSVDAQTSERINEAGDIRHLS